MQKYYKIVDANLPFLTDYNMEDPTKVPLFKTFTAKSPETEYGLFIHSKTPVLHFCDNAFDTMLWYSTCVSHIEDAFVYEIKPIGNIIKEKCKDEHGLYQCGAPQIQFIKLVDTNEMFDLALSEFEKDRMAKFRLYPDIGLSKITLSWLRHQKPTRIR